MINGPNYRKDHQAKSKNGETHIEPLIEFYTQPNPGNHYNHHFKC